jgi:hypothetical protein
MAAKRQNKLVVKLFQVLESKNISVLKFEEETKIPRDRVYKWRSVGTNPKSEDHATIVEWLRKQEGTAKENLDKVPHETPIQLNDNKGNDNTHKDDIFLSGPIKLTAQEYVDALKSDKKKLEDDKKQLQKVIDLNLVAMQQLLSSLSRHDRAYHETILMSLARIEKRPSENDLIVEAGTREISKLLEEQNKDNEEVDSFRK